MTRRWLLAMCGFALLSASTAAQSGGSAPDPITGTWSGDLVLQEGDQRMPVTLQLKHDGKGAVTGTVAGFPNPGEVKKGTFDPKTGAIVLQLGRTDRSSVLISLEGTVAKGIATGRMSGENGPGTFKLSRK